ncbi:hypothetical protein BC628DRAFT_1415731 [Trametes gibbosa]|nr:hypothetical protein BC628DRAFT_1415731 [Trametes gibbosa]
MRHRHTRPSRKPSWFAKAALLDRSDVGRRPSLAAGYALVASSLLFLFVGAYALLLSAFVPHTGVWKERPLTTTWGGGGGGGGQVLDVLARDTHYKYLAIMLVPAGTGFVIANWVGWQYYRNS